MNETRNISIAFNKSSSYTSWKIREVGTDNYWIVSNTGNFQTAYQPGEGKLFRFEPLFTSSGETLSGNIKVLNSLTVPSGKTLNVTAGSLLTFSSGTQLIVNGALSSAGNSNYFITFTGASRGSWNGIRINASGSAGISYSNIRNAVNGIYIDGSNPNIEVCYINDNTNSGIYISGSTSFPQIHRNYIQGDIACIMHYNGGNGYITRNTFWSSQNGVYVISGSPRYDYYNIGRNKFESTITRDKVLVSAGQPWLGQNQFFTVPNSSYNYIRNNSTSTVYATGNYWTAYPPNNIYFTGTGTVDRSTPLQNPPSNPNAGAGWTFPKSNNDFLTAFNDASILFYDKKFKEAKEEFKVLTEQYLDSDYSSYSLNWYMLASEQLQEQDKELGYLKSIRQNKAANEDTRFYALKWLLQSEMKNSTSQKAKAFISSVVTGSKYDRELSFDLAIGLYEYKRDKINAEEVLNNLSSKFTDNETKEVIQLIRKHMAEADSSTEPYVAKPVYFENEKEFLFEAYPNPFNPVTTINYQLTEDGLVNLKIFDILGSEVTTLVNEVKPAGIYNAQFDASNLASGVYIYRIQVSSPDGGFTASKKMILTK